MCKEGGTCICKVALVAKILVIVGAINWGLVGLGGFFGGDWNLVDMLLRRWPVVANIVYVLVGIAGAMSICGCKCKTCKGMCDATPATPAQQ